MSKDLFVPNAMGMTLEELRVGVYTLSKSFRFETAHRLVKGYVGKCSHLHGHSWNGEISVWCKRVDEQGMAVDYKDIGKFCKELEEELDHKTMLYSGDSLLIDALADAKCDVVLFKDNPTSEVLAKYIYEKAEKYFKDNNVPCHMESVTIKETCTSKCVYRKM